MCIGFIYIFRKAKGCLYTYKVDMQCAAVTTQSGAIKDPPQLKDFELPLRRAIYPLQIKLKEQSHCFIHFS